ncbi:hypothetical protein ETAA8_00100 [Anatilimnocola aggregata]|uniref:Uncharacterized protein n=1 Tax=Anatilimnocola aggregata TaxID=2528021 RepID=A0A517Y3Y1_9BACT|nr:hypothetical protein ETAA8_00100 [Anatilimnocola aggregata]
MTVTDCGTRPWSASSKLNWSQTSAPSHDLSGFQTFWFRSAKSRYSACCSELTIAASSAGDSSVASRIELLHN